MYIQSRFGYALIIDIYVGPDITSYIKSHTNCERIWIKRFAQRPKRKFVAPWELSAHLQIPEEHLRLLDMYDSVAQHFIPLDSRFLRPTMAHLNSTQSNIFLSQKALSRDGSIEISAVIDWQYTSALPLYLTAAIPRFIAQSTANNVQDEA